MTKKTKWPGIFLWVVGCLLLVINFIAADYKLITFYWLLRAAQGIILIWLLTKINFSKIKLLGSFVVSMTLAAGLGIYQFLSQNALASKWLGLAMHTASQLGESVVEFGQERWLRAYGPLPHPNILAGFLLVAIIFCVWLINDLRQTTNDKRQKKPNLLLVVSCMLLIVSLFFSFSRAAWLVFGLLVVCWVVRLIRNKELKNDLFKLLVVCCLLLVILSIIYWPLVKTRLGAGEPQRLEVMSNQQRVVGYGEALGLIQDNLWLGVGLGNYTAALQSLRPDLAAWDYQPVHNVCVLVLTEVGLIGIILVLFLLFFYKKRYKDTKEIKRSSLFKSSPVLLYCFITILLLFFFDHFWWTLPSGLLLVFLLVGLLINRKTEDLI